MHVQKKFKANHPDITKPKTEDTCQSSFYSQWFHSIFGDALNIAKVSDKIAATNTPP
ncbi:hypothetical protein LPJ70_005100, partial [Coemansia sp. RSA 2708]